MLDASQYLSSNYIKSHSNTNSLGLSKNKTQLEENRKPRIKPTSSEPRKLILA
jgi:hypothetical protein